MGSRDVHGARLVFAPIEGVHLQETLLALLFIRSMLLCYRFKLCELFNAAALTPRFIFGSSLPRPSCLWRVTACPMGTCTHVLNLLMSQIFSQCRYHLAKLASLPRLGQGYLAFCARLRPIYVYGDPPLLPQCRRTIPCIAVYATQYTAFQGPLD